jgi:putative flippase GtrA
MKLENATGKNSLAAFLRPYRRSSALTAHRDFVGITLTRLLAAALWFVFICPTAVAHHGLGPTTARSFFKVDPAEAHFLVRIPLAALETVGFSLTEREIDLAKAGPAIQGVLNELSRELIIEEDGRALIPSQAIGRLSLPSDRSFDSYDAAVRQVTGPMPPGLTVYAEQGFLDAYLTYPIRSPQASFSIRTGAFPELGDYFTLAVRFIPIGAPSRIVTLGSQSETVRLNPNWYQAADDLAIRGAAFLASNVEYLLFLTCFLVPSRTPRQLIGMVVAFSLAHCLTLLVFASESTPASAWLPVFILAGVATSIVCMALTSIISPHGRLSLAVPAIFGLIFGLLFAYAFKDRMQFAGDHAQISLLFFIIGIEIGQLLLLVVLLLVTTVLVRYIFVGHPGTYVLLGLIALIAWPWMLERAEVLSRTQWQTTELRAVVPWIVGIVLVAAAFNPFVSWIRRIPERSASVADPPPDSKPDSAS